MIRVLCDKNKEKTRDYMIMMLMLSVFAQLALELAFDENKVWSRNRIRKENKI